MSAKPGEGIPAEPSAELHNDAADPEPQSAALLSATAEIERLQQENKRLTEQMLRKQADVDNFRKRAEREKQDFMKYALEDAVKSLLPVLDGFELAMNAEGGGEEYRKGIGLIHQQLMSALQKLGLKRVESKGQTFDPQLHEAIATHETSKHPDNQIVEELQPGYTFKDRLLRPAMVTVARHTSGDSSDAGATE